MIVDENRIAECDGYLIYVHPGSVGDEIYWSLTTNCYERAEAELVREYLPPSVDVIEFGAGLGYLSCVINDNLCDGRRQLAIEPNPSLVPWLRRTKVLNDAEYSIHELAYASGSERVKLDVQQAFWTATTSQSRGIEVPSANLSSLRDDSGLTKFSLVMDIEGAEYEVFTSEMELLEEYCPLLIVEFHDNGPSASSYTSELEESSFEIVDGIESVCVYRNARFT